MKTLSVVLSVFALTLGCGPTEEDVRTIVRDELSRASSVEHITEANVIGPYAPAIKLGRFLFVSGQIGFHPETMQLDGIDIESQTRRALDNLMAVLGKAGYDSSDVIQCSVYLKEINDFQKMNLIYGGYFEENRYPTRTTVEISDLPRNALIEISAIAYKRTSP